MKRLGYILLVIGLFGCKSPKQSDSAKVVAPTMLLSSPRSLTITVPPRLYTNTLTLKAVPWIQGMSCYYVRTSTDLKNWTRLAGDYPAVTGEVYHITEVTTEPVKYYEICFY